MKASDAKHPPLHQGREKEAWAESRNTSLLGTEALQEDIRSPRKQIMESPKEKGTEEIKTWLRRNTHREKKGPKSGVGFI